MIDFNYKIKLQRRFLLKNDVFDYVRIFNGAGNMCCIQLHLSNTPPLPAFRIPESEAIDLAKQILNYYGVTEL